MSSKIDEKLKASNDEVKFISHMHDVLKNGLLGRNEPVITGEEPTKRFFSGVLFPDISFIKQVELTDNPKDPQPIYKSLAKNCNIGLEFLVIPQKEMPLVKISGSFKLYIRLFPTFLEQKNALEFLENIGEDHSRDLAERYKNCLEDDNTLIESSIHQIGKIEYEQDYGQEDQVIDESTLTDEDVVENKSDYQEAVHPDKGLKLLQKYRCIDVQFNDIALIIDPDNMLEIDLEPYINEALKQTLEWKDVFSVNNEFIDQTSNIVLKTRPTDERNFNEWLGTVKKETVIFPEWNAKIQIEARTYLNEENNAYRVLVSLINNTPTPKRDEKPFGHALEFFDTKLHVDILDKNIHVPFEFYGAPRDYKYDKKMNVKGINCVGICDERKSTIFKTECIPDYFQPLYRTRDDLKIKFCDLLTPESTLKKLTDVAIEMKKSLFQWKMYVDNMGDVYALLKNDDERKQCEQEMKEFEDEIQSFELGIYCLVDKSNNMLMKAFNLMNEVFQRAGEGRYDSWRLFQIVFVVRILPSLYAREVSELNTKYEDIIKSAKYADILWFPTGGGKTEAYLGLIVCALFHDRLRGKYRGCTGWLRFPLRMLSKNQLDRLGRILIVAEEIREDKIELSGKGTPFSIGFFAGGGNTPNSISKRKKDIIFSSDKNKKRQMLLHKCPSCGEALVLEFNEKQWRFMHKCLNKECFVYKSSVLKGNLPLYITDSEIYRFIPSVLCGTVDKLSIMARYREFSHLFGQVVGKCDKHGYFSDICLLDKMDDYDLKPCGVKLTAEMRKKMIEDKKSFYDPVPSLFIQDELHLLKEELGALDGHYEGALNEFSTFFGNKKGHLPKVIAATATIEAYKRHIQHLYLREPRRYPSMGYKTGESFYATSLPKIDRRLYIGVLPHSKSFEEVIGRCLYLYHKEIYRLYRDSDTVWRAFGFESIANKDSFLKLLSMYDLSVDYVNKKSTGDDIKRRISEYTNINLKRDVGQDFDLQTELITGLTQMEDIVKVIDRVESEAKGEYKGKLHSLIATNLISHGVDLERINAFFMAGMPSKQAEYIQASSRSARNHAGLVLVCFKANDLRERSQYQYFVQNHVFMDRLVDPVPINRVSLKVIGRSLPGLLCALLLGVHSQKHSVTIYDCNQYVKYVAEANVRGRNVEAELISQLKCIVGTRTSFFTKAVCEKVDRFIENEFAKLHHILYTSSGSIKNVLEPITSFRDIEEGIEVYANTDTAVAISMINRE